MKLGNILRFVVLILLVILACTTKAKSCDAELKTVIVKMFDEPVKNEEVVIKGTIGLKSATVKALNAFSECRKKSKGFKFLQMSAPYAPLFYQNQNVIGYTGSLKEMDVLKGKYPTVYYYQGAPLTDLNFRYEGKLTLDIMGSDMWVTLLSNTKILTMLEENH